MPTPRKPTATKSSGERAGYARYKTGATQSSAAGEARGLCALQSQVRHYARILRARHVVPRRDSLPTLLDGPTPSRRCARLVARRGAIAAAVGVTRLPGTSLASPHASEPLRVSENSSRKSLNRS